LITIANIVSQIETSIPTTKIYKIKILKTLLVAVLEVSIKTDKKNPTPI